MFVPYKLFSIETPLTIDKAVCALSHVVQPSRPFWPNPLSDKSKRFVGSVSEKNFLIVRNVYYLNSFLPKIKGVLEPSERGTKVRITMLGNPCVIVSFVAVFAFIAFFFTIFLTKETVSIFWVVLSVLAGGGLGYMIYMPAFILNTTIDKKYLLALFLSRQ